MKLQVVSRRVGVTLLRDGSVPDGLLSGAHVLPAQLMVTLAVLLPCICHVPQQLDHASKEARQPRPSQEPKKTSWRRNSIRDL